MSAYVVRRSHTVDFARPLFAVDVCDPIVHPPIHKLRRIVRTLKYLHVSSVGKVVREYRFIASGVRGPHYSDIGWHQRSQCGGELGDLYNGWAPKR